MKIGNGSHIYEIVAGWGKLPAGMAYGFTHGVEVDSLDRVYIHNRSRDAVVVFDREGNFISSWGEEFAAGAHGLYLSKEGDGEYLYLSDPVRHQVFKTTLEGQIIFTLGIPPLTGVYNKEDDYKPTDVAVAPNGDFYICDGYGQSWIHQYDQNGTYIRSWGGRGSEPGQLDCPHGIWIDTRGNDPEIYVADRKNNRIQVFDLEGRHHRFITDGIDYPCCFYQFGDELFIADLRSKVSILDNNNQLIAHLGENPTAWQLDGWPNRPAEERTPEQFVAPHAVCIDSVGDLYVVEWVPDGRVTKWKRID